MNAAGVISQYHGIENILKALTVLNLVGNEWPKPACVRDGAEFDFVIVGGGTAGCVVANRLVTWGNFSVLVVEAGGNPPFETEMAGLYPYLKNTDIDWNFTSICDKRTMPYHKNNVAQMTQGKCLGGSGSLNYMGYQRGNKYDYNHWAELTNDDSWSWESVLPTFLKNEQLIDKIILNSPDKRFYGTKGNIKVMKQYFKRNEDYFTAFKELGWPYHVDINPNHPLGFTNLMFNIGDDMRQSTALKFLSPIQHKRNLHVMTNTLVNKIIIDSHNRATGVKVITKDKKVLTIKAKYEVIVSAGAIQSPTVLMRSGIGPKHHLKSHGIEVIKDLPVGQNFQDHVNSHLAYKLKGAKRGSKLDDPHKYPFCIFDGYNALNRSQERPDYQVIGVSFGKTVEFFGLCASFFSFNPELCDRFINGTEEHEILFVLLTHLYPKSRGEIRLRSKNPHHYPIIIPGYYNRYEDKVNHAKYLQDFNRVLKTSYFKKVDAELIIPKSDFCKGLKKGSQKYWRCHTVGMSDTAYYYVGTCGMGPVLDSKLRVHGIKNLRVIDASSFPDTVGSTTQATVIMVAQKGSEFILQEYCKK